MLRLEPLRIYYRRLSTQDRMFSVYLVAVSTLNVSIIAHWVLTDWSWLPPIWAWSGYATWMSRGFFHVVAGYPPITNAITFLALLASGGALWKYKLYSYLIQLSFWTGNLAISYLTLRRVSRNPLLYSIVFSLAFSFAPLAGTTDRLSSLSPTVHLYGIFFTTLALYLIVSERFSWAATVGALAALSNLVSSIVVFSIIASAGFRRSLRPLFCFSLVSLLVSLPFLVADAPIYISNYLYMLSVGPTVSLWGQVTGTDVYGRTPGWESGPLPMFSLQTMNPLALLTPLTVIGLICMAAVIHPTTPLERARFNAAVWSVAMFLTRIGYLGWYYVCQLPFAFPSTGGIMLLLASSAVLGLHFSTYPNPLSIYLSAFANLAVALICLYSVRSCFAFGTWRAPRPPASASAKREGQ